MVFFFSPLPMRRAVIFTLYHDQTISPLQTPPRSHNSSPLPGHGLPLRLTQARRLGDLLGPALALHPLGAEPAHVTGALGGAGLGIPLLAAEPELGVLLGPLVVGVPAALLGPAPLARLVELVVDADVEEVRLVGAEVAAVLGALCCLTNQVSLVMRSWRLFGGCASWHQTYSSLMP